MAVFQRIVREVSDDDPSVQAFRYTNRLLELLEIPLVDREENTVSLIGTMQEETFLDDAHDGICGMVDYILFRLDSYVTEGWVKESFVETVRTILNYERETAMSYTKIDTFHLFQVLNYKTFSSPLVWDYIETHNTL